MSWLPGAANNKTMNSILSTTILIAATGVLQPTVSAQNPTHAAVAVSAQSLNGTVTASDTGSPLAGATVIAIQRPASTSQMPTIYKSVVDAGGNYALAVSTGQYQLCVRALPAPASLYLDPCQWGAPVAATMSSGSSAVVPLSLQKGVRFIVRVHDPNKLLAQAETLTGTAVSAFVAGPSVKQFPLQMVYSDGIVRDYGTVIPINVAMTVTISSNTVALSDRAGDPLSPAMPFEVLPADIVVTGAPLSPITRMFPPPDAKIVHVYATGPK